MRSCLSAARSPFTAPLKSGLAHVAAGKSIFPKANHILYFIAIQDFTLRLVDVDIRLLNILGITAFLSHCGVKRNRKQPSLYPAELTDEGRLEPGAPSLLVCSSASPSRRPRADTREEAEAIVLARGI